MFSNKKKPDFSIYMQATKIGSGVWFMLHLKSFNLIDKYDVISLKKDIDLLRIKFSCNTCKDHLNDFCKHNPPEIAADDDIKDIEDQVPPENLSRLLVDAHNNANQNKFEWMSQREELKFIPDQVRYEDVKEFFTKLGELPCTEDCDKELLEPKKEIQSTKIGTKSKLDPALNWKRPTLPVEGVKMPRPRVRVRVVSQLS